MSPAPTTQDGIEALTQELGEVEQELDEVQWFGRSSLKAAPARVGPLDRLLFLMGATLAGAVAEEQPSPAG